MPVMLLEALQGKLTEYVAEEQEIWQHTLKQL